MSVLLTAGRKINKPKSAKPKKKKSQVQRLNPTPPFSSDKTLVWYWDLGDVKTTVMFTKENNEVWCNGMVLDTIDGFTDDSEADGGVIDFGIFNEETERVHQARIKRMLSGSRGEMFTYQLFVDGYMIREHTQEGLEQQSQMGGHYPLEPPPPYPGDGACAFPNGEAKKDV